MFLVFASASLAAFPNYHAISLNFHDKTSLDLGIDTCFTLEADYFDWKTGRQLKCKGWRPIHVPGLRSQ